MPLGPRDANFPLCPALFLSPGVCVQAYCWCRWGWCHPLWDSRCVGAEPQKSGFPRLGGYRLVPSLAPWDPETRAIEGEYTQVVFSVKVVEASGKEDSRLFFSLEKEDVSVTNVESP